MQTTLNKIKAKRPCASGYKKLLAFLGKIEADDEPLALSTVLKSNGLDDTIWCFRAVSGFDKELRLFAVFCARQVQHIMTDPRSIAAIDVSERYANGNATIGELTVAHIAAHNAANDAATAYDSDDAAFYAARAASDAAYYTAYEAARAAACYARDAYAAYAAADSDAYSAAYTACVADYGDSAADSATNAAYAENQSILEAYLKDMLLETEK